MIRKADVPPLLRSVSARVGADISPSVHGAESPPRILVVDDERLNRQLLSVILQSEGYVVLTAASGAEALAMVKSQLPDLILLDVMMRGMSGHEVAAYLKGDLATKNTPIIMITALNDHDNRMQGLRAGAEDFLSKPVDRVELCARVKNLLRLKAYGDYHEKHGLMLEGQVLSRTADLGESERRYQSTFDAAPVGIVEVGLDGRWLRANSRAGELLGYPRRELEGRGIWQMLRQLPAAPAEAIREGAFEQLAGEALDGHAVHEKQYRRGDGTLVWVRINMSVHRDAMGQAKHFILVMEDVSERRRLEEEVRQSVARVTTSERRYRTLVESASDAIAVLTPEGIIREMNQRWAETTGHPREDLIGRHVRELAQPEREDQVLGMFSQSAAIKGKTATVEFAAADGSTVVMEVSSTAIDVAGEQLVLAIGRDVTEQQQLEKRLREAQKLEVIGQLAGGIAHDFNNLLTAIIGFSDVVIDELGANDPTRADILEIKKAGERAAGLTRQLLAFSRKQILQPTVLDVNELIGGMEAMLRRLIMEHVDVVVSLQADLLPVKMDATQLEQVVINLAVNAADAMPRGGKLTIETANVILDEQWKVRHLPVTPGPYVMLAVSDTGSGMDEGTIRRMFEPFFTTKEVGKGTGLGLATVYGIVKQSGGDIWVYSEPGVGTTFKIYLPQATEEASAPIRVAIASGEITRGSETVLLVEDDESVRRLARMILERAGYNVVDTENPREALRCATEVDGPIDLLLSDVIMPESEGPPLFTRLVADRPNLRVLYMSGYADEAIVRQGVLKEGTPFLQKPFTPRGLTQKVRDVLDTDQTTATSRGPRSARADPIGR